VTIQIQQVSGSERDSLPVLDRSFRVDSKLRLTLNDGPLRYDVTAIAPYDKQYPLPAPGAWTTFVASASRQIVGRIDVSRHWTGFGSIEDLVVAPSNRRQAVGSMLVGRAQQWAVASRLAGLRAETQDINEAACALYARCDFRLAGFDVDLYASAADSAGEVALFWYWHRSAQSSAA
jgi:ribosomal protein S18 acetylase RimI-like enzyme